MLSIITKFLGIEEKDREPPNTGPDSPLHMAAGALLVNVSNSHDGFSDEERTEVLEILKSHFDLNQEKAEHILTRAETFEKNAIDIHSFTRVINMHLEQDGRQDIVKFLWRVAYADKHLHSLEADAIKKIADLLGVTTRDRIRLKQEVEADALHLIRKDDHQD